MSQDYSLLCDALKKGLLINGNLDAYVQEATRGSLRRLTTDSLRLMDCNTFLQHECTPWIVMWNGTIANQS